MTGADVIRIERAGFDFWQFACRWEDPEGQIAGRYAPHIRFADEPETPFVLCLMQRPSEQFPGTGRCGFLREETTDAGGKVIRPGCSIYESRPAACRAFPMKFDRSRELVELHEVFDPPKAVQSEAYKLCPRAWTADDVDGVEAAQTLAAAEYEASFFNKVVSLWNTRPGEWTTFPTFLRIIYSSRVKVEESSQEDRDQPVTYSIDDYRQAPSRQHDNEVRRAA